MTEILDSYPFELDDEMLLTLALWNLVKVKARGEIFGRGLFKVLENSTQP